MEDAMALSTMRLKDISWPSYLVQGERAKTGAWTVFSAEPFAVAGAARSATRARQIGAILVTYPHQELSDARGGPVFLRHNPSVSWMSPVDTH